VAFHPFLPRRRRRASPRAVRSAGPLLTAFAGAALLLPSPIGARSVARGSNVNEGSPSFAQLHYGARLARSGTLFVEAVTCRYEQLLSEGRRASGPPAPMHRRPSEVAGAPPPE
jgi:hypothetical protein